MGAEHAKAQLSITRACAPETRMSADQLKHNADRHDDHDDLNDLDDLDDHDEHDDLDDHNGDVHYDDPGQIFACSERIVLCTSFLFPFDFVESNVDCSECVLLYV